MFSKTYLLARYNALIRSLIKSQPMYDEACSILLVGEFPKSILNKMTLLLPIKIESDDEIKKTSFVPNTFFRLEKKNKSISSFSMK